VEDVAGTEVQTAMVLKAGGLECYDILNTDDCHASFLRRLKKLI
jgi:hypothetical protein